MKEAAEDVQELERLLTDGAKEHCDEAMAKRYLRATQGDTAKAAQRIENTVKWRRVTQPEALTCISCSKNPGSHYMNVVGRCKKDRPVMYSCMKLSRSKTVEGGKHHLVNRFEQAIRMMPEGVEQWVWVSDFYGFSLGDMNPAMAKQFVDLSAVHYPERLGAYLVIDAPHIFEGLWKIVKPWLDPVTAQKIIFLPYDISSGHEASKLCQSLQNLFPADLCQWLLYEMAENRKKESSLNKTSFEFKELYQQAIAKSLQMDTGGHDIRGTRVILEQYLEDPSLLLPQANALQ